MNSLNSLEIKQIDDLNGFCKTKNTVPKFSLKGINAVAACVKVYDGDTIHLIFALNSRYQKFSCRMFGYNSAEMNSKSAEEKKIAEISKNYLASRILNKVVYAKFDDFDKYGRPLVTIYELTDTKIGGSLNDEMLKLGHGKPYLGFGEKKY